MTRPSLVCVARSAARLLICSLAGLALLLIPALLLTLLFDWLFGSGRMLVNLPLGLICSLIAWLFVAVFHLTPDKVVVSIGDRKTFLAQVRVLLDEMGYETVRQTVDDVYTRPRFNAFLFGGGVQVSIDGNRANLIGPKISAEILRKRLRMFHQLFRVQDVLDAQRKSSEPLLKRVEISLRVKPDQLAAVQSNVLEPLAQAGEVVCEVYILVQSEQGVRESTIEKQVKPWAQQHDIPCDVHKHHSSMHESMLQAEYVAQ